MDKDTHISPSAANSQKVIKVLLVDDHESVTEMLANSLKDFPNYKVVGRLRSAALAYDHCLCMQPDLIMMDICTEDQSSGLEATAAIKAKFPLIKIIIMTGFDEITYVPRAKEAGADAFVYKRRSIAFFMNVIHDVMNGISYFPEPKEIPLPQGTAPLTDREMEILRLMCRHMSNKEIADELFISEHTVKYHKSNMLAKTGFEKTIDLIFFMVLNGWINPMY